MKSLFLVVLSIVFSLSAAQAEDINKIFENVQKFIADKNYPKAMEELTWAEKEIQKLHSAKVQSFLPDKIEGFTGEAGKSQSAFGISNIERTYKDGNKALKLQLSGMGGGGKANPLSGFASIARMGQMMGGNQPGMDTFRIEGRTAHLQVNDPGNSVEMTVYLESGSILQANLSNSKDGDLLKSAIQSLKIVELDNYLSGKSQ